MELQKLQENIELLDKNRLEFRKNIEALENQIKLNTKTLLNNKPNYEDFNRKR